MEVICPRYSAYLGASHFKIYDVLGERNQKILLPELEVCFAAKKSFVDKKSFAKSDKASYVEDGIGREVVELDPIEL